MTLATPPPEATGTAIETLLRHRLAAAQSASARLKQENAQLRQQLQALIRKLTKREAAAKAA
jgi:predicted phage-related endonuclease